MYNRRGAQKIKLNKAGEMIMYVIFDMDGVLVDSEAAYLAGYLHAARLYGLYPRKGVLAEGSDADLVILDPAGKKTVTVSEQVSKCDYAPLEGMELTGTIEAVFLRGEKVAENGRVILENRGQYLKRNLPEYF
jgi:phosphoglycolate phosphatase-like HAD superfamily hydrolase